MGKFEIILNDLEKALTGLETALALDLSSFTEQETDVFKNGQIQKFEYSIELLWKTIKQYFEDKKDERILYAKDAIKAYFMEGNFEDKMYEILFDAIESRNLLSHIYKSETFELIHPHLNDYAKAIRYTYSSLRLQAL